MEIIQQVIAALAITTAIFLLIEPKKPEPIIVPYCPVDTYAGKDVFGATHWGKMFGQCKYMDRYEDA